jgi:crotonobetainyl-CoA:carnitine CoA-transferase CaiB-like acyl-CoA transferase
MLDRPEWTSDPRLSTRAGWGAHLDELIRPAVEGWAATRTRVEVCDELGRAGIPTGPCFTAAEVVADPHVRQRSMLVEMDLGADTGPVLVPGNPVKLSNMAEGPETRVPWVGEHTHHVLADELGLSADELAALAGSGVISPRDDGEWSAPSPPAGSAEP